MEEPIKDRSRWPQAKLASFDEVRAYRIRQWQEAGCTARLVATWELVTDYWVGMKGKHPDELRLQRSIAHLRRRADYLGKSQLISAKQNAGRPQDLADIEEINRADGRTD